MIAEVISIGDELTSGQRLDTNSQWLSQRLGEIGVATHYHSTVSDDLTANLNVFRTALDRADIVVATGGLGPTADDLTREVLAQLAGVELLLDPVSLEHILALFARRQRAMPERNRIQAMFPQGSRPIPNPEGTAPGIALELPRNGRTSCRIYALPGVPAEMRQMWQQTVAPELQRLLGGPRVLSHRRVKCFGVGESDLEAMLPDLIRRGREPSVGITVHEATITLRITAGGASQEDCLAQMQPTLQTIESCLGELIFGAEDDELEHAVVRALTARRANVCVIDCATQGLVGAWLADADAQRSIVRGTATSPDTSALATLLGLMAAELPDGAEPQALTIARAARARWASDYALVLGPVRATTAGEPSAWACALIGPETSQVQTFSYTGHSAILRSRAAKQALNVLRLSLLDRKSERTR